MVPLPDRERPFDQHDLLLVGAPGLGFGVKLETFRDFRRWTPDRYSRVGIRTVISSR
jgi:hypothetical protein